MAKNHDLHAAQQRKEDEFYTQLRDIEVELYHYRRHFKNKTVLCNCDDPRVSNFFRFFSYQFEHLGLKRLITTCYKSQSRDLFSQNDSEKAIWLEYTGDKNGNRIPDPEEIGIHELKGDGDFRSAECIELLKQADIVVTNPPFSLFREYIGQLVQYKKKFLIIGHMNAVKYKEVFPLFQANKVWYGVSIHSGDREFMIPDGDEVRSTNYSRVDKDGHRYVKVNGVRWFTNLDHAQRHEELILFKRYAEEPETFPKYDYYDAINVDKTSWIPEDYDGVMGVPISFMDKFCPEQFEIIGLDRYVPDNPHFGHCFTINGQETYSRILIRRKGSKQ